MGAAQPTPTEAQGFLHVEGFTWEQVAQLHERFLQLSGGRPSLRQEDFVLHVPDLQLNPIGPRIIRAFFDRRNLGPGLSGTTEEIHFPDFLAVIRYFRPVGPTWDPEEVQRLRREKLRFLFHLYDSDGDGRINLLEYARVVEDLLYGSLCAQKECVHAQALQIARRAVMEALSDSPVPKDPEKDSSGLTFEDFLKTWKRIDVQVKMQIRFLNPLASAFFY